MEMSEHEFDDPLESRLALIERRLNRLRTMALLLLVLAGSTAILFVTQPSDIQSATTFVVQDSLGRPRATLGVAGGTVALSFYDDTGQLRADYGLSLDGRPGLLLMAADGAPSAILNTQQDGSPILRLMGANGEEIDLRPEGPDGTAIRLQHADSVGIVLRLSPTPALVPLRSSGVSPRR